MKLALLDPALFSSDRPSPNIGDHIISRASVRELKRLFGNDAQIEHIPTHSKISKSSYRVISDADHIVVGGSNLLWFRYWPAASWPLGMTDFFKLRNVILMGVGWGSYNIGAGMYSRLIANLVLSENMLHSVRDAYTEGVVRQNLSIPNVLNTGCHTTWWMKDTEIAYVPYTKKSCIFTVTDYAQDMVRDSHMLNVLTDLYGTKNLVLWPQGSGDAAYAKKLGFTGNVIKRKLGEFIDTLIPGSYDYVGTRLHAGVLAMEHHVRSLIIGIDNRALEIGKDIQLPVLPAQNIRDLENLLNSDFERRFETRVDSESIDAWTNQFLL